MRRVLPVPATRRVDLERRAEGPLGAHSVGVQSVSVIHSRGADDGLNLPCITGCAALLLAPRSLPRQRLSSPCAACTQQCIMRHGLHQGAERPTHVPYMLYVYVYLCLCMACRVAARGCCHPASILSHLRVGLGSR